MPKWTMVHANPKASAGHAREVALFSNDFPPRLLMMLNKTTEVEKDDRFQDPWDFIPKVPIDYQSKADYQNNILPRTSIGYPTGLPETSTDSRIEQSKAVTEYQKELSKIFMGYEKERPTNKFINNGHEISKSNSPMAYRSDSYNILQNSSAYLNDETYLTTLDYQRKIAYQSDPIRSQEQCRMDLWPENKRAGYQQLIGYGPEEKHVKLEKRQSNNQRLIGYQAERNFVRSDEGQFTVESMISGYRADENRVKSAPITSEEKHLIDYRAERIKSERSSSADGYRIGCRTDENREKSEQSEMPSEIDYQKKEQIKSIVQAKRAEGEKTANERDDTMKKLERDNHMLRMDNQQMRRKCDSIRTERDTYMRTKQRSEVFFRLKIFKLRKFLFALNQKRAAGSGGEGKDVQKTNAVN